MSSKVLFLTREQLETCVVFFFLVPGILQLWEFFFFFLFCILNVVAVGDSELEEAARSVLCFFPCPWSSAVVGVFFFVHSECSCSRRFRTGGNSCEHLRRILQEENNSGVLFTTAAGNSCCFLPCPGQISAVVGVFLLHSECSCNGRIITGGSSWEQYLRSN